MKVGIVGVGTMGRVHAEAYSRMEDVEIVSFVDVRPEARETAERYGGRLYGSLEELIREQNPDIVDVSAPTDIHKNYVLQAAGFGKHVFCEKPIALTLEDADEMIEACDRAGVRFMAGQVVRFFPEYRKVRELVLQGAIGQVGTVRTSRVGTFSRGTRDWFADPKRSGGVMLDLLIHDLDWPVWTFGKVRRVYAQSSGSRGAAFDHTLVSLRFENGVIGRVEGSWALPQGFRTSFEIAGREGILTHDPELAATNLDQYREHGERAAPAVQVPESPLAKSPYQLELEHFLACVRSGETPSVTGRDAREALRVGLAALESVGTGQAVRLD